MMEVSRLLMANDTDQGHWTIDSAWHSDFFYMRLTTVLTQGRHLTSAQRGKSSPLLAGNVLAVLLMLLNSRPVSYRYIGSCYLMLY